MPTRLALTRVGDRIEGTWDPDGQVPVEVETGCRMLLGHEVRQGVARPGVSIAEPSSIELGGGADFSGEAGRSTFFVDAPREPGPWVVRAELTIFDTDVPPQHGWSPRSGRFEVVLERVIETPIE